MLDHTNFLIAHLIYGWMEILKLEIFFIFCSKRSFTCLGQEFLKITDKMLAVLKPFFHLLPYNTLFFTKLTFYL